MASRVARRARLQEVTVLTVVATTINMYGNSRPETGSDAPRYGITNFLFLIEIKMSTAANHMVFCSIGENCLGQGVLDRKKFSTCIGPFSWVRTNIDYILEIVEEDFGDLLNPFYLQHRERFGQSISTNSKYRCDNDVFESTVSNEFEFTHHDIILSADAMQSAIRKIDRFKSLCRSDEAVIFMYHHRWNYKKQNLPYVLEKLNRFAKIVQSKRKGPVSVLCFTQKLITCEDVRRIEFSDHDACRLAVLHTYQAWGGTDSNVFWGKVDDDLFDEMLSNYRTEFEGA